MAIIETKKIAPYLMTDDDEVASDDLGDVKLDEEDDEELDEEVGLEEEEKES